MNRASTTGTEKTTWTVDGNTAGKVGSAPGKAAAPWLTRQASQTAAALADSCSSCEEAWAIA